MFCCTSEVHIGENLNRFDLSTGDTRLFNLGSRRHRFSFEKNGLVWVLYSRILPVNLSALVVTSVVAPISKSLRRPQCHR